MGELVGKSGLLGIVWWMYYVLVYCILLAINSELDLFSLKFSISVRSN